MKTELKTRKPKAGLLLIASPRFKNLYGPQRGTYGDRKEIAVKDIKASMEFLDLVDPGIVYEREDAQKAIAMLKEARQPQLQVTIISFCPAITI